jgi:peptidoglycan hydrolase-like protein with peptidoglycan-binding domain
MLSGRVKLQLAAFLFLSTGVAGNLFFLQPHAVGSRAEDERRMAGAAPMAFGEDTGSIVRGETGSPGGGIKIDPLPMVEIPQRTEDMTRAVQRELQMRGYETGGADGVVGLMTRAAVMGFEYDHGMVMTGRPSEELLKRIVLGGGGRAKPIGSKGQSPEARDVIRTVQTSLVKLGYRPGGIDGQLSPETARAIREFEVDQTLTESGRVSGPLVVRLARLVNEGRVASGR